MMDRSDKKEGGRLTLETSNLELTDLHTSRYLNTQPRGAMLCCASAIQVLGCHPSCSTSCSSHSSRQRAIAAAPAFGSRSSMGWSRATTVFIDVQSEVGKGYHLHDLNPQIRAARKTTSGGNVDSGAYPGSGLYPCSQDDEQQVCNLMARVLTSCGCNVLQANNGRSALQLFADGRGIDLVILDMMMPEMGGRECLARMREIPHQRESW